MADENPFAQYALFDIPIPSPQMVAPANFDQSVPTLVNSKEILEATLQTLDELKNTVYSKDEADGRFYPKSSGEQLSIAVSNKVNSSDFNREVARLDTNISSKVSTEAFSQEVSRINSAIDSKVATETFDQSVSGINENLESINQEVNGVKDDVDAINTKLNDFVTKTDTINGLKVQMADVTHTTGRLTGEEITLYNVSSIKFKPSLFGMFNGEVLKTVTLKVLGTVASLTLKRGSDVIGTSVSAEVDDQLTVFTFPDQMEVHFIDNEELTLEFSSNSDIHGYVDRSPSGISCDGHDQSSELLENCEPYIQFNWMTPATATVILAMIKRLAPNFREKLADLVGLQIFGDNDYSVDDLRERLDLITRVLKNLGEEYRDQLEELTEIGEDEYETDDLRKRLDTILVFLQGLATG